MVLVKRPVGIIKQNQMWNTLLGLSANIRLTSGQETIILIVKVPANVCMNLSLYSKGSKHYNMHLYVRYIL
jgi:hypothetical protein